MLLPYLFVRCLQRGKCLLLLALELEAGALEVGVLALQLLLRLQHVHRFLQQKHHGSSV